LPVEGENWRVRGLEVGFETVWYVMGIGAFDTVWLY
jgi:hypothetical protein